MFKRLTVEPRAFFELLVQPHFADLIPDGPYSGTLNEFTVMNDVTSERTIIDILGARNILKRRDATCNLVFTPVGRGATRKIMVDPIYSATKHCDNEFYAGCLEDFRDDNPNFRDFIMDFFLKAIKVDLDSNTYFGDVTRADDATGIWSWNVFDGIFKRIRQYIQAGTIPAAQTIAIPAGAMTASAAFGFIQSLYKRQDVLLDSLPASMKAFYVSKAVFEGYREYLQSTGQAFNIGLWSNGIPQLFYNQIPVLLEPTWHPILQALNSGTEAHAAILTIRGNFVFGTDNSYGELTDQGVKSLMVWYSYDELSWKYAMFMKAGTQVALPQHMVIAQTAI